MEETTITSIISIIKSALGIETSELSEEQDIKSILSFSLRQSILYIVYTGLSNLDRADLLNHQAVKDFRTKSIYDFVQRKQTIKEISSLFEMQSIQFVPLKGAVICDLYPDPCMRSSADVDILIHESDIKRATRIIENDTNFKHYKRTYHDVHFINNRVHLELHYNLTINDEKADTVLSGVWNNVIQNRGCCLSLNPEFQLFYIVAHSAKHFVRGGGIGVRPLLDLWLLRTKTAFCEDTVKKLCGQAGILKYYETCCDLLDVWFMDKNHSEVTREFERVVFSGGVYGIEQNKIIYRKRTANGKQYIRSRVFISSKDIKALFPVSKRYPFLVPFFQVVRWVKLLSPKKRRTAKDEIELAHSIDKTDLERFDWLLTNLDL